MSLSPHSRLKALKKSIPTNSKWRHFRIPDKTYVVVGIALSTKTQIAEIIYKEEGTEDMWRRHPYEWFQWIEEANVQRFTQIE